MKLNKSTFILMLPVLALYFSTVQAQEIGNKNVVTEERELPAFHGIDAGGSITVYIEMGESQSVKIETDENLLDNVSTQVKDEVLVIKTNLMKDPTKLNAYIKVPGLDFLKASGATDIKGKSTLQADNFKIIASGATSAELNLEVQYLESDISGAADVILTGSANTHVLDTSGAGSLDAGGMVTSKTRYSVSGASDVSLNATEELNGYKKGAAEVSYVGNPKTMITTGKDRSGDNNYSAYSRNYNDSVKVKVGNINVEVYEGDDSVTVRVGNRELHIDDEGNVRFSKSTRHKFNGHWAGFDLGMNGFVNPEFNMSFPPEDEYLDLRMTKSISAHINFFEQNVAFSKNQKWGMVTGLGLSWNNYRFDRNTRLEPDSSYLIGYLDQNIAIRKSKLNAFYGNIPLIFEFQTNSHHKKNSFHIGIGMVANVRLSSHTKKYYDERNKEFEVTQYNPETNKYETVYMATSPDYSKTKDFDDFHMQPFKFDGTIRIGWGFINLFANYSVNQMFKKDKGPELYPWEAGITLANF
ncbi:MAG: DUF2807 domain-containing protein [Bacteroidales bacterium]|nr:DUF2807 domain-containing protein [Bacteroidales bacterium]